MTPRDKQNRIRNITLIGLVTNIFLAVIKLVIGFFGNSQAVMADALHSFSDTSSDLVILFGVRYWTAPPDEAHPFGHQKIETLITILIGIILVVVAFGIGYNGVMSLLAGETAVMGRVAILGPLISIVVKEILFRITDRVGTDIHSPSVRANAWHHRTDSLSSIPVLIAVTATLIDPRLAFLDPVGALIVSAFIIRIGFGICFTHARDLLDTGITGKTLIDLKKTIQAVEQVKGVHKIRTRKLADSLFIDLHLEVDGRLTVTEGHTIAENVKQSLIRKHPRIIDVMVHLEPEQKPEQIK